MLGGVVIFQLSLIASVLASTGLRFSEHPAFAAFKGWNARITGNLTFYFKTESENGFLIYQDDKGQCQYIYLSLADGRLRLRLKMHRCDETQTLHVGHNLDDGKWHKVTVQRDSAVTRLTVDNVTNSTTYNGKGRKIVVFKSDLLVGGIPLSTPLNYLSFPPIFYESNHFRFQGCISGIQHNVGEKNLKPARLIQTNGTSRGCLDPCSKNGQCKNGGVCRYDLTAHCDCRGTRFQGTNCTEETASIWLSGSGYIVFRAKKQMGDFDLNDDHIAFHLKTKYHCGIICSLQSHLRNFLLIEMMNGKLRVEMDLGEGRMVLSGSPQVNDGKWHYVELTAQRQYRNVTLMIDHHAHANAPLSVRPFKPTVIHVAGGPRNVSRKSESKQNFSGYLQEFYFGKMKILDSIVPTITDRRFSKVGIVSDGFLSEGSGGSGCSLGDDEDDDCDTTTATPVSITTVLVTSTASELTTELVPKPVPTGVQAQRSLPQVLPFWVISVLVAVAATATLVTLFFVYRWNSRYSGSFEPESSSSSCGNSPKHGAYVVNPRIHVTVYDEKI